MLPHTADSFEFGSETGRSDKQTFDWSGVEPVSLSVVRAVAEVRGTEATELEPLSNSVDTDALNQVFQPSGQSSRKRGHVKFKYEGCLVKVGADGEVVAVPSEA